MHRNYGRYPHFQMSYHLMLSFTVENKKTQRKISTYPGQKESNGTSNVEQVLMFLLPSQLSSFFLFEAPDACRHRPELTTAPVHSLCPSWTIDIFSNDPRAMTGAGAFVSIPCSGHAGQHRPCQNGNFHALAQET
jgi:hypothetical protein